MSADRLAFGCFELDLASGEMRKAGRVVPLRRQPFLVLAALAARPGVTVPRDELRAQVWGDGTFVDFDQGLNYCVKEIRAALGDAAASPRWIETLPRRGYRFIGAVEPVRETSGEDAPRAGAGPAALGVAIGVLVGVALMSLAPRR